MTCYWDAILSALTVEDFKYIGKSKKMGRKEFIQWLKSKNSKVNNVLWQGTILTEQEKVEHHQAIKGYDIGRIGGGHLTSTCDSFLLLICEVFRINIRHRFLGNAINYANSKGARKTLSFSSNRGHFRVARL